MNSSPWLLALASLLLAAFVPPGDGLEAAPRAPTLGIAAPADTSPGLAARLGDDGRCGRTWLLRISDLNDVHHGFRRLAEISGRAPLTSQSVRRLSHQREAVVCGPAGDSARPWGALRPAEEDEEIPNLEEAPRLELLPVRVLSFHNSAYPDDLNNGAVWAGRGWSTSIRAGVHAEWGPLSATLDPSFNHQENEPFDIPADNPFVAVDPDNRDVPRWRYPWHGNIDWPLRFGEQSYWRESWGQSSVRLELYGLNVGFAHENVWRGPARRYPIILSNTAEGFPHLFVGTAEPKDVGVGWVEAEFLWGELTESAYFDRDPANDRRIIGNGVVAFRPAFAPGLTLGVTSVYENVQPPGGLPFSEWFQFLVPPVSSQGGSETAGNALGSIFGRWALPESGFEVYAEWAREDFAADLWDFVTEPDHSQAYMLGFQKVWAGGDRRWVRLGGELIHLQSSITGLGDQAVGGRDEDLRPAVTYYVHSKVTQGHTQRGQLLGAYIGPGSFAQHLAADLFASWGTAGLFVERVRRDDDAYYGRDLDEVAAFRGHDLELTAGLRGTLLLRELGSVGRAGPLRNTELRLLASFSARRNRNFLGIDRQPEIEDLRVDENWKLEVGLRWHPTGLNRSLNRSVGQLLGTRSRARR